jgi:hypothetical protein
MIHGISLQSRIWIILRIGILELQGQTVGEHINKIFYNCRCMGRCSEHTNPPSTMEYYLCCRCRCRRCFDYPKKVAGSLHSGTLFEYIQNEYHCYILRGPINGKMHNRANIILHLPCSYAAWLAPVLSMFYPSLLLMYSSSNSLLFLPASPAMQD